MASERCPHCGRDVRREDVTCPSCGKGISTPVGAVARPPGESRGGFMRLVWGVCLLATIFSGVSGFQSISTAGSAPQQAAGAAMGCFYLMLPYVFARSLDEVLGRPR